MITFNGVLKYDAFLAPVVRDVLRVGSEAMGRPVEIEFAVNLNRKAPKKPEFSLLQIRPIAQGSEESDVSINDDDRKAALIRSTTVLGNGTLDSIEDIIYLKFDTFDSSRMVEMANELDELNVFMVLPNGITSLWSPVGWAHPTPGSGFPFLVPDLKKQSDSRNRFEGSARRAESRNPLLP